MKHYLNSSYTFKINVKRTSVNISFIFLSKIICSLNSLASGFIAGMLRGGLVSECAAAATRAALLSLQATAAVPPTLGAPPAVVGADRLAFKLVPHRE
jgi:hypothetical protein